MLIEGTHGSHNSPGQEANKQGGRGQRLFPADQATARPLVMCFGQGDAPRGIQSIQERPVSVALAWTDKNTDKLLTLPSTW